MRETYVWVGNLRASHSLCETLPLNFVTVAIISLEEALISVNETDAMVMLCAELLEGVLERNISGLINTMDQSAVGEILIVVPQSLCSCCLVVILCDAKKKKFP